MSHIIQFLYENAGIDTRKIAKQKLNNANIEEKKGITQYLELHNLFLLRRCRDPGFYKFVTNEISNNDAILNKTQKYIESLKIRLEIEKLDKIINFNIPPEILDSNEVYSNLSHLDENILKKIIEDPKNFKSNLKNKINNDSKISTEYLQRRYHSALKRNDMDEAEAIMSLISDYSFHKDYSNSLFSINELYPGYGSYQIWNNEKNLFRFKNINHIDNYFNNTIRLESFLKQLLPLEDRLVEFALKSLNPEIEDIQFKDLIVDNPEFFKYCTDFLSVASEIWFNGLEKFEKINLLNEIYPFKLEFEDINNLFKLCDNNYKRLFHYTFILLEKHFYEIAIDISNYILAKSDDIYLKFLCYDCIATMNRQLGYYDKALSSYEISYKILEEYPDCIISKKEIPGPFGDNSLEYNRAIRLKNIGEMQYQTSRFDEFEKSFEKIIDISDNLSPLLRSGVYFNLSCAYRRMHNYTYELKFLTSAMENPEYLDLFKKNNKYDELIKRLNDFNSDKNMNLNGEVIESNLENIDKIKFQNELLNKSEYLYAAFQFEDAKYFMNSASLITNNYLILFRIGRSNFELKQFHEAEINFKTIITESKNHILILRSYCYLGLIDLLSNNWSECFKKIQKFVTLTFSGNEQIINEQDFTISLDKNILQNYEIALFESLIVLSLNFSDDSLTYKFFDYILEVMKQYKTDYSPYAFISSLFLRISHIEGAHRYLDIGTSNETIPNSLAPIYETRGDVYAAEGMTDKARDYYFRAEKIGRNEYDSLYVKISYTYEIDQDYKIAENYIGKAIEINPDNQQYNFLKKNYEVLSESTISFFKVKGESKNIFKTAELLTTRIFHQIENSIIQDFDFSIALIEYGKGVEKLLHDEISLKIRDIVLNRYQSPIEKKYWNGQKGKGKKMWLIKPLPYTLKNILGIEEKTISLGQWIYLMDDLTKSKDTNPISKIAFDYLAEKYDGDIEFIEDTCDLISELRNGSAHLDLKTREDVLDLRREVNKSINGLISNLIDN